MKFPFPFALLVLAGGCAAAGPYAQPYSIIENDPVRSADPDVVPIVMNRVDDRTSLSPQRDVVAPGTHQVTIYVPPRKGFFNATQQTFELKTEPCTRYYLSAKLDNPVGQRWTPVVRSTERIGECEAKFAMNR
jgi:hypothetical protein